MLPGIKEEVCVHEGDRDLRREVVVVTTEILSERLELQSLAILQSLCINSPPIANCEAFSLSLQEIMISCKIYSLWRSLEVHYPLIANS